MRFRPRVGYIVCVDWPLRIIVVNPKLSIPWQTSARLLSPGHADFNGSFFECLERWDKLRAVERSQSFIVLSETIQDKSFLKPSDLTKCVSHPEFLTHWKS